MMVREMFAVPALCRCPSCQIEALGFVGVDTVTLAFESYDEPVLSAARSWVEGMGAIADAIGADVPDSVEDVRLALGGVFDSYGSAWLVEDSLVVILSSGAALRCAGGAWEAL